MLKRFRLLVCQLTLLVYGAVNVLGLALHHHEPENLVTGSSFAIQALSDDDDDECVLCAALHLAQTPPPECQLKIIAEASGTNACQSPISCPHSIKLDIHCRAPPV